MRLCQSMSTYWFTFFDACQFNWFWTKKQNYVWFCCLHSWTRCLSTIWKTTIYTCKFSRTTCTRAHGTLATTFHSLWIWLISSFAVIIIINIGGGGGSVDGARFSSSLLFAHSDGDGSYIKTFCVLHPSLLLYECARRSFSQACDKLYSKFSFIRIFFIRVI